MASYVAPTGYVDLDNDCQFAIDVKSTRSRESIDKTDLPFYFNNYLEPKYGLGNININNCASFMKDLEMNWTKLDNNMKNKVLDIMVDYIFASGNFDFKKNLLAKMGIEQQAPQPIGQVQNKSTFGKQNENGLLVVAGAFIFLGIVLVILDKTCKGKVNAYSKMA
jgi:hypothetical protein